LCLCDAFLRLNLSKAACFRENLRVECGGKGVQSLDQRRPWCIEKFIAYAIDASSRSGPGFDPAAVADNLFQWHAVSDAAPGKDHDIRIGGADGLSRGLPAGLADK